MFYTEVYVKNNTWGVVNKVQSSTRSYFSLSD